MKILISWIGLNKDFVGHEVSTKGPNYRLHAEKSYDFDKHLVLYNREDYEIQALHFTQKIAADFKHHRTEIIGLLMDDERDLNEVQHKVFKFLKALENDEVTILITTGTSIFKIVWYIFASSLQQIIHLIQYRDISQSFDNVRFEKSAAPYSLMVNEQSVVDRKSPANISGFYESPFLKPLFDKASKIAVVDNTVLISGDTGTGKEQLAHYIHKYSPRQSGPFLAINCSSFTDEMLSSELFGHTKGAYTGALHDRTGVFEQAKGGTVFMDEIGDISPFMQQSMLRVLQEKKIQKMGAAGKDICLNVRVIAATNKNLLQKVTDGSFREDLYYRLAVNELEMPALKDWPRDEKFKLIRFFISKKATELRLKPIVLSKEAEQQLIQYSFPGNIRELENTIAGLYPFRTDNKIEVSDFPKRMQGSKLGSLKWSDVEANHIRKVLTITRGNQNEACREIGMSINTFKARLKAYEIQASDFK
jgi:DNA-binding NtrC family response regulator